jgi:hypothetical protein
MCAFFVYDHISEAGYMRAYDFRMSVCEILRRNFLNFTGSRKPTIFKPAGKDKKWLIFFNLKTRGLESKKSKIFQDFRSRAYLES